jgi:putative DNA primase/helicase
VETTSEVQAVDPGTFFTEKGALRVGVLAGSVERHLGNIRASADGHLYRYEKGVYRDDGDAQIRFVARALLGESATRHRIGELLAFFRDRETANPLSLDPDQQLVIRAQNGILDAVVAWQAKEVGRLYAPEPYTPDNATTLQLPWEYDPAAECPQITTFLRDVFDNDNATVWLALEAAGYALLSRNPLRKAFLLYGPTASGKSTFLWLLTGLIGKERVSAESLYQLGSERFSPVRLVGKLANICPDIGTRAAEDSSIFKAITGGSDPVRVERKGRDAFDFYPSATLLFSANEYPASRDVTEAYFQRWVTIEFPRRFAEDAHKEAELRALASDPDEMRGFLRYSVEAVGRLLDRGRFEVPASSVRAGEQMRESVDSVAGWLESEEVIVGDGGMAQRAVVYREYQRWCREEGKHALGRSRFFVRLRQDHRLSEAKREGVYFFANLRLVPPSGPTVTELLEAEPVSR